MTRTITTTGVACRALLRARNDWDVTSPLTDTELDGLRVVDGWRRYVTDWTEDLERDLARLLVPIDAVIGVDGAVVTGRWETRRLLLHGMLEHAEPPGMWSGNGGSRWSRRGRSQRSKRFCVSPMWSVINATCTARFAG